MHPVRDTLWILLQGVWQAIALAFTGVFCCITIIGIPIGLQCFKFMKFTFLPFDKEVEYSEGTGSLILNIIWIVIFGVWFALGALFNALLYCITIIGIPFAKQNLRIAKLVLLPFGATIVDKADAE